ncbi:PREDICTED: uncharacterized protein K02A2.6-like [Trachymyrmex cornetzi]|uniref:uncharacterized protein K02A2.6-like n=1 Tax=Trachymyrmex cornetzi TaxID=471704 RepID=UPI00084F436C|nr:PREDICTED: uncharacterized protein K02A2.6-like [Trachymyrmex cornetzi]
MTANGFQEKSGEVKVAILLNTIGDEGIDIFNNFNLSEADQKKYDVVVKKFDEYFLPKKNIIYERFLFYKRIQEPNEPVDNFVKKLKKIAQNCEFMDEQDMIRDRIVLGIADVTVQEKLLGMTDLKLEKAVEICRAKEKQKKPISPKDQGRKEETQDVTEFQCRRCNRRHRPRECPAFGKKCNRCGKLNHFEVACRVKGIQEVEDVEEDEMLAIESVNIVKSEVLQISVSEWFENVKLENKIIKFKLDTGAQVNILPEKIFNSLNSMNTKLEKTNIILEAYGGQKFKPSGKVRLRCKAKGCVRIQEFIIVRNERVPLLGLKSCIELGLLKKVVTVKVIEGKDEFIKKNEDLFSGIGTFQEKCKISLKQDCCPVVRPPRRIPLALKDKLKTTLNDLESKGIIAKTKGPVEWSSNLVIVEKPNGTLRICLDPVDLNKSIKRELCLLPTLEEVSATLSGKKWFTVLDLKDGFYHVELDKNSSKLCIFGSPFGSYNFKRLPFGLSLVPELFQKINNKNFGDIEGVIVYIDDIFVETKDIHDSILDKVLEREQEN